MKWRCGFQLIIGSFVRIFIVCVTCVNRNYFLTSKAMSLFENDERFKAVERPRDREDLFDNYIVELERKVSIWLRFWGFRFHLQLRLSSQILSFAKQNKAGLQK